VTVYGAKAAPAGSRWVVQLGAFRTHDHAAMLAMTLQSHGTAAQVVKRDDGTKGVWYVVRTPSLPSLAAAQSHARGIAAREHVAASVQRAP
jgi:cell division septation protein DedD